MLSMDSPQFTRADVIAAESELLKMMDFNLAIVNPLDFIDLIFYVEEINEKKQLAKYILSLLLQETDIYKTLPS